MTKIRVASRQSAVARYSRWSVVYNIIFVVNLATTPFLAYLTEPRPGGSELNTIPPWSTFEEFTNVTFAYLHNLYNNESVPSDMISAQDVDSNTFAMRYDMVLPYSIPDEDAYDYLITLPGAPYFATGLMNFVTAFLKANQTTRAALQPWRLCQHNFLLGLSLGDFCFWFEQVNPNTPQYIAWVATHVNETPTWRWFKLVFRFTLTTYVLYVLWTQYYRHDLVLLSNLRERGLSREYKKYVVVVGDPAYAIMSNPVVLMAMVIDIWGGSMYFMLALVRVSQFQDFRWYALGCIYISRSVRLRHE
ncbi:unnamed protein product [Aphanomyces euteiches]